MRGTNQKLKALYLKDILEEETDNDHAINMKTIQELLAQKDIPTERRSVYDDIRLLRDTYGLPIEHEENGRTYRLEEHLFQLSELKLIIDAVASSKTLTEAKSLQLIEKLKTLCSKHERATLWGQIIVTDRAKTQNNSVHYNIDELNKAIGRQKWVKFQYYYYDVNKEKVFSYGGRPYTMKPVSLVYSDNNYYLLCLDKYNRRRHFRVDRMTNVRTVLSLDFSREKALAQIELSHYTKYTFSMYGGGDIVPVTMRFHKKLVSMVLDRFGHDVALSKDGDSHFTVTQPVAVSPQFFAWLFALEDQAEIIAPISVKQKMEKMLKKAYDHYASSNA